jgi:hypothetical protein
VKVTGNRPKVGTRVRAKIGKHTGIEAVVIKTTANMVFLQRTYGRVNGSSKRGSLMKLPIDAYWRRYEAF